jgi:uncharacterized protein YhbP (UPF0306 family)
MPDLSHLQAIVAESTTLTLATLDPDGTPRATPLFFAADDGLNLYFLSDPDSQHARNLRRDPQAAVGLYPRVTDWRQIRGLQMKGRVDVVPQGEHDACMAIYRARFPFLAELPEAVSGSKLYCFAPGWIRLVDNRQGFGHQQEWRLP